MELWQRTASLQVGAKKYRMEDFQFEFEVPFEDSETLQEAAFRIYNLNENSRMEIRRGHAVILNAGYENDLGVIFIGQVSACSHQHNGTDWLTNITAVAAMDEWLNRKVNKTYMQNMTAKDIIPDLLNIFGLEVGEFELAVNKNYPRGRVCQGKVKDVLIDIAVNECRSRFLIKDNSIIINNQAKGTVTGYVLTPESGLLLSGGETEETVIAVGIDSRKDAGEKEGEGSYITRECLLNYRIKPADQIKIQSRTLNGNFHVIRGRHTGSPAGAWKTVMELQPY